MRQKHNIAIDGPAGAGKSTVARILASKLGYLYIDTGAMYRALTLKALRHQISLEDVEKLTELAGETHIELRNEAPGSPPRVFCDGEDVTDLIREPRVSNMVSHVADVPGVRLRLVELQRLMANRGGVVMDGRDIGSFVLPEAKYKFFLTTSPSERAKRRHRELKGRGISVSLKKLKKELKRRDRKDIERGLAPLVRVPEAQVIDTGNLSPEEVVDQILKRVNISGGEDHVL